MAKVDLHNFFKFYDEKNENHVKGVQWLEDHLPVQYLEDKAEWAEIFRKKTEAVAASAAAASGDDVPAAGLQLIKQFEGCRLNAYPDPLTGGLPITIGWGCTRDKNGGPFRLGQTITQAEADSLLMDECRKNFLPALRKIPHWNEMSDGQRGALLSFAYNLGAGFYGSGDFNTITTRLKNKEWDKVPDALYLYRNPGSNVEAGLARRRKAEGESWKK
jgi:lysozyme